MVRRGASVCRAPAGPVRTRGVARSDQSGKGSVGSGHYENFRATKFSNPPCWYKVISTSFSNDAITRNAFPVLVCKHTETSREWTSSVLCKDCSPTLPSTPGLAAKETLSVLPDSEGSHDLT